MTNGCPALMKPTWNTKPSSRMRLMVARSCLPRSGCRASVVRCVSRSPDLVATVIIVEHTGPFTVPVQQGYPSEWHLDKLQFVSHHKTTLFLAGISLRTL